MKKKDQKKKAVRQAAKGKKAAASPQSPQPARPAATLARTPMDIPAADLEHAPWNPRASITPESVADLTESIRRDGLIQRLVVVKGDSHGYLVVAGNRRLVACREAGLDPVPCEVMDVTHEQARRLTLLENLQRQDADPLLESELVDQLMRDGMTLSEIAAETGRGERWCARRANLRMLSPKWRKLLSSGANISLDCLERVAAYPEPIQNAVAKGLASWQIHCGSGLRWNAVSGEFRDLSCDLSDVQFVRSACANCPNNSACAPLLFADGDSSSAKYGRCLDPKCYRKKLKEHIDDVVAKAENAGHTVMRVNLISDIPDYWDLAKRRDEKHPVLWVATGGDRPVFGWGKKSKPGKDTDGNQADAEKALAEKREKRERNKAIRKLAEWCGGGEPGEPCNLAKLLDDRFSGTPTVAPYLVQEAFSGVDGWHFHGCKTNKQQCAISAIFGNFTVPFDTWAKYAAAAIIRQLDPSKNKGWRAKHNAELLAVMFPKELLDAIGAEAFAHVRGNNPKDGIVNPTIAWCVEGEDADAEPDPDDMGEEMP